MRLGLLLLILSLAGCAPISRHPRVSEEAIRAEGALQRRLALEIELERRQRLFNVVYRLARAAAPECGGGRPLSGVELGGGALFQKPYRQAAEDLGFDEKVRVMAVAADSPAARSGLAVGDTLTAINGTPLGRGRAAFRDATFELRDALASGPVRLTLVTENKGKTLTLMPEKGCPTDLFITREPLPTPKANGKAVLMPVSFMRSAQRDDELAEVTAFLMAYNIRGQADSTDAQLSTDRRNFFALVGEDETNLFQPPQPLDYLGVKEADRQAMIWLRRTGYDPLRALHFWRRYLAATPALEADTMWGRNLLGAPRMVRMKEAAEAAASP